MSITGGHVAALHVDPALEGEHLTFEGLEPARSEARAALAKGGHISSETTLIISFCGALKACSKSLVAASVVRCSTTSSTLPCAPSLKTLT